MFIYNLSKSYPENKSMYHCLNYYSSYGNNNNLGHIQFIISIFYINIP